MDKAQGVGAGAEGLTVLHRLDLRLQRAGEEVPQHLLRLFGAEDLYPG